MRFLLPPVMFAILFFSSIQCIAQNRRFNLTDTVISISSEYQFPFRVRNMSSRTEHLFEGNQQLFNSLLDFLEYHSDTQFEIAVYTTYRGSREYNLKISQRTAEDFKDHLVDSGVDRVQLVPKGYGECCLFHDEKEIENLPNTEREKAHLDNGRIILRVLQGANKSSRPQEMDSNSIIGQWVTDGPVLHHKNH